jgi:hypothetical protein
VRRLRVKRRRHYVGAMNRVRISLAFLTAALAAAVVAGPAQAQPTATPLVRSNLGAAPFVRIHDAVVPSGSRRAKHAIRSALSGYGGVYYAPDGTPVHVFTSNSYAHDGSVNQSYADFLGGLYHGTELAKLTVYVAPYDEMQRLCGADSDACYTDDNNLLVTLGDTPPDGTSIEDLAAHEYGHHIANHRLNQAGRAPDYGPTYWSTYEHVCERDGHTMFPGNEGKHYEQNPGEGWAETYRALNGKIAPWNTVGNIFYPTNRSLALAKRDVLKPYDGGEYIDRKGRLSRRRHARRFRVPVENDGRVSLALLTHGTLNGDLYVFARKHSRKPLDRTRKNHLSGIYCGYRHLYVAVKRAHGRGSFRLRATLPFFTTN